MTRRQLALRLSVAPSYARDDFLVTESNRHAWSLVEAWPRWADRVLMLIGPAGSGKTHLARIWADRAGAICLSSPSSFCATDAESALPGASFLLEDVDRLQFDEAELFHLLNHVRNQGCWLVLTARTPPGLWGVTLADLVSRLRLSPICGLAEPDGDLMQAVLTKLFVDRQLIVEASVVEFLALRIERSFDAARRIVDLVDAEALAQARPITRPLVSQVLAQVGPERDEPSADRAVE